MSNLVITIVNYAEAALDIQAIRREVFQIEQGVELALDFDGLDETTIHMMAYWLGQPVGTARIRYLPHQIAKIERVAVLASYRGLNIGRDMMMTAIEFLDHQEVSLIKLNAQLQVESFYQKLGFKRSSETFYDAGILHVEMQRINPGVQSTVDHLKNVT